MAFHPKNSDIRQVLPPLYFVEGGSNIYKREGGESSVLVWFCLLIWSEKSNSVEVDQVRWRVGYPNVSFPRDLAEITPHQRPIWKGCHVYQPGFRVLKEFSKLCMAFAVNWTVAGNGFNQQEPITLYEV